MNYNKFLPDTQNNSLNSTIIHNENLNGTRNLTQQDIQTPSHFINEEIVQTTATTTQQSISPIHPNLTTTRNTNTSLTQVTLQSTVKPSVAPKYSHMDYQTYRPMTTPSKTRKPFTKNTFAEHNYNYAQQPRTNQPPRKNTQNLNHVCSHYWNLPKTLTNSVNFPDNPQPTQDHSENYPFFHQNKNKQHTPYNTNYLSSDDDYYHQPDIFAPYTKEYRTQRPRQSQPSQNMKTYIQNPQQLHIQNLVNTQSFQPIQPQNSILMHSYQPTQMQNEIPLPYYLQQHEITKKSIFKFFTNVKCRRITTDDYESIPYGWIINNNEQTIIGIHRKRPCIFCRRLSKCSNSKFNFKYRTRTN